MLNSWERPGMEVPPTVKRAFACAVYDLSRGEGLTSEGRQVLETQYFTEGFYFEAVEAVFEFNDWKLTADQRKVFRKVFRDRKKTGA